MDYSFSSLKLNVDSLLIYYHLFFLQVFSKFLRLVSLSQYMVFVLTLVVLLPNSFCSHALTTKTTNIIHGSAPYLTFDGGRTRVTDTNGLLGIYLSTGDKFTPTTNISSSSNPIELPIAGQSFEDIDMLVPKNVDSIELSSLIGEPYNYWGDDDGDGFGDNNDRTAMGKLSLTIVDKMGKTVSRKTVPSICNAPYLISLISTNGSLRTRYGVPNESRFNASNVTYYINPKESPKVCFAKPNLILGKLNEIQDYNHDFRGPETMWNDTKGFIPQSTNPASYNLNFPTTGADHLYFDLDIGGSNQALSWTPVTRSLIKATMTNVTKTNVRVTLTGPVAKKSQWESDNPGRIDTPSLPQTFELVGRDSDGKEVVKYGFVLKQWFINRGEVGQTPTNQISWCDSIGYRLSRVKDLTNAACPETLLRQSDSQIEFEPVGDSRCKGSIGAMPLSMGNSYQRIIGAGLYSEWGRMDFYSGSNFSIGAGFANWTSDKSSYPGGWFSVYSVNGVISSPQKNQYYDRYFAVCVSP